MVATVADINAFDVKVGFRPATLLAERDEIVRNQIWNLLGHVAMRPNSLLLNATPAPYRSQPTPAKIIPMPFGDEASHRTYFQVTWASYHKSHLLEIDDIHPKLEFPVILARHHGVLDSFLDV